MLYSISVYDLDTGKPYLLGNQPEQDPLSAAVVFLTRYVYHPHGWPHRFIADARLRIVVESCVPPIPGWFWSLGACVYAP
jgi:hypothetical protein